MTEAKFLITLFASSLVVMSVAASNPAACSYPPCELVPEGKTYFYPNWEDCSTYWVCQNKQSRRSSCPAGQVFDLSQFQCRPRPLYTSLLDFFINPVFSCEVLLHGFTAMSLPQA
ncbi:uncharacterized protein LOC143274940 [Babylonia areolata]|uniref:uncharacterized protein LOC143274940 n=1 Tax=Babylonia areolata TaxID=304850 RepID=UPI003FD46369